MGQMKLRNLSIYNYGTAEGTITFQGPDGVSEVKIKLSPVHIQQILEVMKDTLIDNAREAATALSDSIVLAVSEGAVLLGAPHE